MREACSERDPPLKVETLDRNGIADRFKAVVLRDGDPLW